MKVKIVGGELANPASTAKPKHANKKLKLKSISTMFNKYYLEYTDDWGNPNSVEIDNHLKSEVERVELVTEENKVNFVGAAGWGIVGGLLTGGIGLLAGALLGGRGKKVFAAMKWKDGSQFLLEGNPKDIAQLMQDCGKLI